jgi:valyl-tRNA synthetase
VCTQSVSRSTWAFPGVPRCGSAQPRILDSHHHHFPTIRGCCRLYHGYSPVTSTSTHSRATSSGRRPSPPQVVRSSTTPSRRKIHIMATSNSHIRSTIRILRHMRRLRAMLQTPLASDVEPRASRYVVMETRSSHMVSDTHHHSVFLQSGLL